MSSPLDHREPIADQAGTASGAGSPLVSPSVSSSPAPWQRLRGILAPSIGQLAAAYLVALAVAELVTTLVSPVGGVVIHLAILGSLLVQAARATTSRERNFFSTLMLCPLIRIVSMGMPLGSLPQIWWYALTALPLLAAAGVLLHSLPLAPASVGLRLPELRDWPLTLAVAASGAGLGWIEYQILPTSTPLAPSLAIGALILPSVILLIGTGLMEEVVFRGLLQTMATELLGVWPGIIYVSLLFATLHTGHRSLLDVLFVFPVAIYFSLVVRRTGTLVGVSLAHGLTNIMLFIVLPLLHH